MGFILIYAVSMAIAIPTAPPASARAGDTWVWQIALPDYPAPAWELSYSLYNATALIAITATASGAEHLIRVESDETAEYAAGRYDWVASVASATPERYQVAVGVIQILPDMAAVDGDGYDGRSIARQMLDAIDALLLSRASGAQVDLVRMNLGDRYQQRDPAALLKWRQHYAAIVANEDRAAAAARGQQVGFIQGRFR